MKQPLSATAVALACSAALAQTPANPAKVVEQGAVPTAPRSAAAAEAKVDARQAANPGAGPAMGCKVPETGAVVTHSKAQGKAEMNVDNRNMAAMDTNGDGMISRMEYDAYHNNMWKKMSLKNGMATQADVQMMLKQGLGGM